MKGVGRARSRTVSARWRQNNSASMASYRCLDVVMPDPSIMLAPAGCPFVLPALRAS